MMVTRRGFLRRLIGFAAMAALPFSFEPYSLAFPAQDGSVRSPGKRTIGSCFAGEELEYEVSFWFLKRVAVARMRFARLPEKGRYVATLEGETVGLVGWLTGYRVDRYRAVMEEVNGGGRLRSQSFDEYVKIGSKVRKNIHRFDHEKRTWVYETSRRDGRMRRHEYPIPEGRDYNDFVTASYNFRYRVYGQVERGKRFVIPTFPRKGPNSYEISIATKKEEDNRRQIDAVEDDAAYFITLVLDPEVVNSKEGVIEGWLSKDLYPLRGTIKEAILFGDVKGRLVKRTVSDEG